MKTGGTNVIRIPKEVKVAHKEVRRARVIKSTEYAKAIRRRSSIKHEFHRRSTISL